MAGRQRGLIGEHSKYFYSFIDAATRIEAETIVAENVPNLLSLSDGDVFREVLRQFREYGYRYCAWRTLNAQQFGLPHSRNRLFIVASNDKQKCFSLFKELPHQEVVDKSNEAAGFYWTAGTQSICYSDGFVPTIKVGSSLSIPSPPAVHYGHVVRQLTPFESLRLQGFDTDMFEGVKSPAMYRMAGNAVAVPVGQFVVDGVMEQHHEAAVTLQSTQGSLFPSELLPPKSAQPKKSLGWEGGFLPEPESNMALYENGSLSLTPIPRNGFFDETIQIPLLQDSHDFARNLIDYLDTDSDSVLSKKAASGLLRRLSRSGLFCPSGLKSDLEAIGRK